MLKRRRDWSGKIEALRASRVLWVYGESQKENERLLAVLTCRVRGDSVHSKTVPTSCRELLAIPNVPYSLQKESLV